MLETAEDSCRHIQDAHGAGRAPPAAPPRAVPVPAPALPAPPVDATAVFHTSAGERGTHHDDRHFAWQHTGCVTALSEQGVCPRLLRRPNHNTSSPAWRPRGAGPPRSCAPATAASGARAPSAPAPPPAGRQHGLLHGHFCGMMETSIPADATPSTYTDVLELTTSSRFVRVN